MVFNFNVVRQILHRDNNPGTRHPTRHTQTHRQRRGSKNTCTHSHSHARAHAHAHAHLKSHPHQHPASTPLLTTHSPHTATHTFFKVKRTTSMDFRSVTECWMRLLVCSELCPEKIMLMKMAQIAANVHANCALSAKAGGPDMKQQRR